MAEQSPGVSMGMTQRNAPAQGTSDMSNPFENARGRPVLSSSEVHHYGEPVALAVAETFEQA